MIDPGQQATGGSTNRQMLWSMLHGGDKLALHSHVNGLSILASSSFAHGSVEHGEYVYV